jgi:hypothetical protein
LAKQSLLGAVPVTVSLEYGERFAAAQGLEDVMRIIDGLYSDAPTVDIERRHFMIREAIPLDADIPGTARDFVYCPELVGYPVLLREKSYTDKLGFLADSV